MRKAMKPVIQDDLAAVSYTGMSLAEIQEGVSAEAVGYAAGLLVDEFLEGRDAEPLIVELHLKQPQAFQLLLHTGKSQKRRTTPHRVCKWEHAEMKAAIRQYLAA